MRLNYYLDLKVEEVLESIEVEGLVINIVLLECVGSIRIKVAYWGILCYDNEITTVLFNRYCLGITSI
jgi:hypothetical protein